MNNIKSTLITILLLIVLFFSGMVTEHYRLSNTSKIDTIGNEIKTLYKDRLVYVHDTIEVERTKTKNKYISDTIYIDSLFKNGNDNAKIVLFDSIYPKVDTNYLMRITNSQAKSAIERSKAQYRDSLLLETEKKNSKNCDTTLSKVITKVDTLLKEKIVEKSNFSIGALTGFVSTILLVAFGYAYFF